MIKLKVFAQFLKEFKAVEEDVNKFLEMVAPESIEFHFAGDKVYIFIMYQDNEKYVA